MLDPHHRAIKRDTTDEALGPVDGVENPGESAGAGRAAEFFTQNPIVGKRSGDAGAEKFLRGAVGDGDRRLVGLLLNSVIVLLKVLERQTARFFPSR
jgi:hypothetical protein